MSLAVAQPTIAQTLSQNTPASDPPFTPKQTALLNRAGAAADAIGDYPTTTVSFKGKEYEVNVGRAKGPMQAGANVFIRTKADSEIVIAYMSDGQGSRVNSNGLLSIADADVILEQAVQAFEAQVGKKSLAPQSSLPNGAMRA